MKIKKDQSQATKAHIECMWEQLTRHTCSIVNSSADAKVQGDNNPVLYHPRNVDTASIHEKMHQYHTSSPHQAVLKPITSNNSNLSPPGLIYLPNEYIIPGGMFSEMYGWDSYFIIEGLLISKKIDLAIGMTNNLLFMVEHFGKVLNANRTYYLNRSQPPLLSCSVFATYQVTQDKQWLTHAIPLIIKDYEYWCEEPRLIPKIGLSRYAPEEHDEQLVEAPDQYYDEVKSYFRENTSFMYDISEFYSINTNELTSHYFKADAAVRESGFDITNKFGPFSIEICHYIPIGLNSMLYQIEKNIAFFANEIGDQGLMDQWNIKAQQRQRSIRNYLFSPALNQFFDLNYQAMRLRPYSYATTFYPLWAGLASPDEAKSVQQLLPIIESNGGIMSSTYITGMQWDAPFGWAPHQFFTVKGLLNYGYEEDAKRIAGKFCHVVNQEYERTGHIYEKYDVIRCTSDVSDQIKYGYNENMTGFGWTNAVYLYFDQLLNP